MINRLIHFLILPCSKISFLIEKKMARQLSITEKVRLNLHLQVCRLCSIYEKKVRFLDKSLERQIENKESNQWMDLADEFILRQDFYKECIKG